MAFDGGSAATDSITGSTTLATQAPAWETQTATVYPVLARFVVTPGAHSFAACVTSATGGSNDVTLLGFIIPPSTRANGMFAPSLSVGGVYHYQNDPNDTSKPLTATYDTNNYTVVREMQADGARVVFADVRKHVNAYTDMLSAAAQNCIASLAPGAHLNDCGNIHAAQAIEETYNLVSQPIGNPYFVAPPKVYLPVAGSSGPTNDTQPNAGAVIPTTAQWAPGVMYFPSSGYESRSGFSPTAGGVSGTGVSFMMMHITPDNSAHAFCFHTTGVALTTPSALSGTACKFYVTPTTMVALNPFSVPSITTTGNATIGGTLQVGGGTIVTNSSNFTYYTQASFTCSTATCAPNPTSIAYSRYKITLTTNVTSLDLGVPVIAGFFSVVEICQDSTGGRTTPTPASFTNWPSAFIANNKAPNQCVLVPFSTNASTHTAGPPYSYPGSQTYENVTYSATPAFDTPMLSEIILTGSVTSWTLANPINTTMTARKCITWIQDATGGRSVAGAPTNVRGFVAPGTTASKASTQCYLWSPSQSAYLAESTGVSNQ